MLGHSPRTDSQAGLIPEDLHGAPAVPRLRQFLQAPLHDRREFSIGVVSIRDKRVIRLA
jgi:hypothetical protein